LGSLNALDGTAGPENRSSIAYNNNMIKFHSRFVVVAVVAREFKFQDNKNIREC
jgi:hypothetical protein